MNKFSRSLKISMALSVCAIFLSVVLNCWVYNNAVSSLMSPRLAFSGNNYPQPSGHVNDWAEIIDDSIESKMEAELLAYKNDTTIEIAVVTTKSLDGRDIDSWSIDLATLWGVGDAKKDNGLLITVAPNEKKWRIEVGDGLEGDINDAKAGRIARNEGVPFFRKGEFGSGIHAITTAIMDDLGRMTPEQREKARVIAEEEAIKRREANIESMKAFFSALTLFIVVLAILFLLYRLIKWIRDYLAEQKRLGEVRANVSNSLSTVATSISTLKGRIKNVRK